MIVHDSTLNHPNYNSLPLLDYVVSALQCRYDSELALRLSITGGMIRKVRYLQEGVSPNFLLQFGVDQFARIFRRTHCIGHSFSGPGKVRRQSSSSQ
jgi:hypothetical protein